METLKKIQMVMDCCMGLIIRLKIAEALPTCTPAVKAASYLSCHRLAIAHDDSLAAYVVLEESKDELAGQRFMATGAMEQATHTVEQIEQSVISIEKAALMDGPPCSGGRPTDIEGHMVKVCTCAKGKMTDVEGHMVMLCAQDGDGEPGPKAG